MHAQIHVDDRHSPKERAQMCQESVGVFQWIGFMF